MAFHLLFINTKVCRDLIIASVVIIELSDAASLFLIEPFEAVLKGCIQG
jgi:hypothetical protein